MAALEGPLWGWRAAPLLIEPGEQALAAPIFELAPPAATARHPPLPPARKWHAPSRPCCSGLAAGKDLCQPSTHSPALRRYDCTVSQRGGRLFMVRLPGVVDCGARSGFEAAAGPRQPPSPHARQPGIHCHATLTPRSALMATARTTRSRCGSWQRFASPPRRQSPGTAPPSRSAHDSPASSALRWRRCGWTPRWWASGRGATRRGAAPAGACRSGRWRRVWALH